MFLYIGCETNITHLTLDVMDTYPFDTQVWSGLPFPIIISQLLLVVSLKFLSELLSIKNAIPIDETFRYYHVSHNIA